MNFASHHYCQVSCVLPDRWVARRPVWLLVQQRHVQVAARPPLALGDVLEPGGHQLGCASSVEEGPDHPRASPELAVEELDRVVGVDLASVLAGACM